MEIYVVGVHKRGKKIEQFKVISVNDGVVVDRKDVSYASVYGVVQNKPGLIRNLKIEAGELKGINGSLDRYGVCGKTQALVILNEITSPSGSVLGYFCSDANGNTKRLSEQDTIDFADKIAIANGKVVPDASGKKHISCIEGSYKSVTEQSKTPERPVSQVQPAPQHNSNNASNNTNQQNQNSGTPQNDIPSTFSDSDKQLINNLRNLPNFNGSFASKIIDTIVQRGFITAKQRYTLKKEYEKLSGTKLQDEDTKIYKYNDVKSIIDELETFKEFKSPFVKKIADSVKRYDKCTAKQKAVLDKELDNLRNTGTKIVQKQSQPVVQEAKAPATPVQQTPAPATPPVNNTPTVNNTVQQSVQQTTTQPVTQPNNVVDKKMQAKADKALKDLDNEVRKLKDDIADGAKLAEQKRLTESQKRANSLDIRTDNIFDYALHKSQSGITVFIEGFHKGVDTNIDLIIPETATIEDKVYKINGIHNGAFSGTKIKSVVTSKNMEDIGQGAFKLCVKLESADLSASQHSMIASELFFGCSDLSNVKLGSYIQRVHEHAFENCFALESVTIPECCRTIARNAFANCTSLVSVDCKSTSLDIDYGAFALCKELKEFNFSNVVSIATQAFRKTGFTELNISGSTRIIGDKAFADCYALSKVTINEGVEVLGEFVFDKPEFASKQRGTGEIVEVTKLDELYAPKSLKEIRADAFRHVGIVIGYTGTVAESKCIAFNTPFRALDAVNKDNSTNVRIKSEMLGANPIEIVKNELARELDGLSNPATYELHTHKFMKAPVGQDVLGFLGFEPAGEEKEPHVKFKGIANYLQDVSDILKTPLLNSVLRLKDTFSIINVPIYDDGYNRVSRVTYEIMDTLENGSFIVITQGNLLQYICDCNLITDIVCTNSMDTNVSIPLKKHLHSGDIIGENTTIDGVSGTIVDDFGKKENIGKILYLRAYDNGIDINVTRKEDVLYVPAAGVALELHDRTKDKLEEDIAQAQRNAWNNRYSKEEIVPNKSVISVMDYDGFVKHMKGIKKNLGGSSKFFEKLGRLSAGEVNRRITRINTIDDEKEAHLFAISKQYVDIVNNSGQSISPNLLTYKLLSELTHSYWIVSKDEMWFNSIGAKSLNKTAEYHIGQYKLTEYKSNQIVKFSNPYMNGKKGAYVFKLTQGNNILGVYTSRYDIQYICEKLYELTYIPDDVEIPDSIMQNPRQFDRLSSKLFYPFYDVMQSKNGWSITELSNRIRTKYSTMFNISMYKPTGVFYLTMSRITLNKEKRDSKDVTVARYATTPIIPIGNMDRALTVATTTNINAKKLRVYEELLSLAAAEALEANTATTYDNDLKKEIASVLERYYQARELILNGVKGISSYKKLVDSRVAYMIGTVQKGKLQREDMLRYDDSEYDDEDDIVIEDSTDELENVNLDEFNEEPEDDVDIEEELENDNEEIDFGDDEEDDDDSEDGEMTFEEFFETAKSMGITDETQARAMFISFKNQQR